MTAEAVDRIAEQTPLEDETTFWRRQAAARAKVIRHLLDLTYSARAVVRRYDSANEVEEELAEAIEELRDHLEAIESKLP